MSTNYYFKLETGCKFCKTIELHIGKRSIGWGPSFQKTEYYSSVEEIREFYTENKDITTIINEYDEILTFHELEENLINWNRNKEDVLVHSIYYGDYRDSEGYFFIENDYS